MAQFVLTKSGISDDAAPSGTGYAGRTFTVPTTVDDGAGRQSGGLSIRAELKTAGGVTVTDGLLTASLWLKLGGSGGTWTQIGDPQTVPRGRRFILPFGDIDIDTPGAVQITSVSGSSPAVAASVELTCEVVASPAIQVGQTGLPKYEPTAIYKASPPVLAESDTTPLLTDTGGNIKVALSSSSGSATFPAAAPLSDSTANPTTTLIGALLEAWDVVGAVWKRVVSYNVASDSLTDPATPIPLVGSFLVAWDNGNAKWRRLKTDTGGSLKTRNLDANGAASFPDNATPTDAAAYGTLTKLVAKLVASNGTTDDMVRAGLTAVQTAATGMLNALGTGIYNLTRPVLADTNLVALQVDQYGNLKVVEQAPPDYEDNANDLAWMLPRACNDALGAWTKYDSGTTLVGTAGLSVLATPGRLRRAHAQNTHASNVYWLVLVDKASAAVNNDAVKAAMKLIPAGATPTPDCAPIDVLEGIYCSLGISLAISTTPHKVTLPGTSDCHIDALYT